MKRLAPRRGFTTLLVIAVVAVGVITVVAIQASAFAQAAAGREAVARTRAKWAARAGIESAIAALEIATRDPETDNAFHVMDALGAVGEFTLDRASVTVLSSVGGQDVIGAVDAHAKLNINLMTRAELMTLPYMTEDVADAILDWIDSDDDTNPLGAEASYYLSREYPYLPRNAPIRHIAELELIAGVLPEYVRGEDWNLNGVLDPNENDGDASFPDDNADGVLDAGWSGILTAGSTDGGLGLSGEPLLDLSVADAGEVRSRLNVDQSQADHLVAYAQSSGASMATLIRTPLNQIRIQGSSGEQSQPPALNVDQFRALLDECTIGAVASGAPGKLNINTCDARTLEYLPGLDPAIADAIIFAREGRPAGFASMADLLEVSSVTRARLAQMHRSIGVRSNAFVVTSRGRDEASGVEVEMIAVIDRMTLPVTITDLRTR